MKKPKLPRPQVTHSTQYVRSNLGFRLPVSKVSDMTDHATYAKETYLSPDINVMLSQIWFSKS